MRPGYIMVPRSVIEPTNPLRKPSEPFDRLSAWLDLVSMASYASGIYATHYGNDRLERGEFVAALDNLAARWHWHRNKVARFLKKCTATGLLSVQRSGQHGTVYFIVDYDTYQGGATFTGTATGMEPGQDRDQVEEVISNKERPFAPVVATQLVLEPSVADTASPGEHLSSHCERPSLGQPPSARAGGGARKPTKAAESRRQSWLSPVAAAWERARGPGSFATLWGEAGRALKPIHDAGTPSDVIAANLGRYLEKNRGNYASITKFAQSYAEWKDPGPVVDPATGLPTAYGAAVLLGVA
jgi:hypothetical protein